MDQPQDRRPPDTRITPAFHLTCFSCPNCHEVADQVWLNLYAEPVSNPAGVPLRITGADLERLSRNAQFPPQIRAQKLAYWNKVNSGAVFLDRWAPIQTELFAAGMELSACRNCGGTAVWIGGQMVYPAAGPAPSEG